MGLNNSFFVVRTSVQPLFVVAAAALVVRTLNIRSALFTNFLKGNVGKKSRKGLNTFGDFSELS